VAGDLGRARCPAKALGRGHNWAGACHQLAGQLPRRLQIAPQAIQRPALGRRPGKPQQAESRRQAAAAGSTSLLEALVRIEGEPQTLAIRLAAALGSSPSLGGRCRDSEGFTGWPDLPLAIAAAALRPAPATNYIASLRLPPIYPTRSTVAGAWPKQGEGGEHRPALPLKRPLLQQGAQIGGRSGFQGPGCQTVRDRPWGGPPKNPPTARVFKPRPSRSARRAWQRKLHGGAQILRPRS